MILEKYLNESAILSENVEPLSDSLGAYITPDNAGIANIVAEATDDFGSIDQGVLLVESIAYAYNMNGNSVKAEQLQEASFSNALDKIKEALKKLWEKIKKFFQNVWRNIYMWVADVNKVISKYYKNMDKDLSDYTYKCHEWKDTTIANSIAENAKKLVNEATAKINSTKSTLYIGSDGEKPSELSSDDRLTSVLTQLITGKNGTDITSLDEAKEKIQEEYFGDDSLTEFEGNGGPVSIDAMKDFIVKFKDNKVLKKLETDSNKVMNDAIKGCADARKYTNATESKEGKENRTATVSKQVKMYQAATSNFTTLMGYCTTLEQLKFKEYKKIVYGAIKFKPEENK